MFFIRPSVSPSVYSVFFLLFFGGRNSTETSQQNFVKLCSYEGNSVYICAFDSIFFLGVIPLLNLDC